MKKVLVTGSEGFLGKNICISLSRQENVEVFLYDVSSTLDELEQYVAAADFIFHLAGVNRPKDDAEFETGNHMLTTQLCELAEKHNSRAPILLSSSVQSEQDNAYGRSKKAAEDTLLDYQERTGIPVMIYRFPNLFGKWSNPNYNSVIATFCYNITRNIPVQINDPDHEVVFTYVDDVVRECLLHLNRADHSDVTNERYYEVPEAYMLSIGKLAELIAAFRDIREGGPVPDLSDPFTKKLYSTFLSYYDVKEFSYPVDLKIDNRGWLFELVKSEQFGQIFVSTTHPGITRGNHGHDTKVEKFCVIKGDGIIRFRHLVTNEVISYTVSDEKIQIVDIPPGYTHSIENSGEKEMITLFWANEIFNPERPDTYFSEVLMPDDHPAE